MKFDETKGKTRHLKLGTIIQTLQLTVGGTETDKVV